MASKMVRNVAVAAVVGVASYWFFSPYLDIRTVRNAAAAQDADTFNEHVDYPKLRESLKGQLNAKLAEKMGNTQANNDFERAGAAFGSMLGMAMANQFVEAMVRPEFIMKMMANAKAQAKREEDQPHGSDAKSDEDSKSKVKWSTERKGLDKLIAKATRDDSPGELAVVFERYGFATWKLTELRLPKD